MSDDPSVVFQAPRPIPLLTGDHLARGGDLFGSVALCGTTAADVEVLHLSAPDSLGFTLTACPVCKAILEEVTPARARMLAQHAIHVQHGVSDPAREAVRARDQLAMSPGSIDWDQMADEVNAATMQKVSDLPRDDDEPPPDPGTDSLLPIAKLRRYLELRGEQAIAEAEGKAIKDEANLLEGELVEAFSEAQMQNVNLDGKTVYLHRSTFAQRKAGVETEDLKAGLRAAGADDLITETVNAQTLSAYVRELTEDDDAPGLPEPLVDLLELGERYAIRIKASASRTKR